MVSERDIERKMREIGGKCETKEREQVPAFSDFWALMDDEHCMLAEG